MTVSYSENHAMARVLDPNLADAYMKHLQIGDPLAEAALDALSKYATPGVGSHSMLEAAIKQEEVLLFDAPDELKEFFDTVRCPPPFELDPAKVTAGSLAFFNNADMCIIGLLLGSLINSFTEEMCKSFYLTGPTTGNVRRVLQNVRHIVEVLLPGGMSKGGEGWKMTIRIRLIHAQVRRLMLDAEDWDVVSEGLPLNMSHMALVAAAFSGMHVRAVRKLGVHLTDVEQDGLIQVWRYVAWLFGVPEPLLVSSESESSQLTDVAHLCESRPGPMAIELAAGYVSSVPDILGLSGAKRSRMMKSLYRTSRALIGDELADDLDYPKLSTRGAITKLRLKRWLLKSKIIPGVHPESFNNFAAMITQAVVNDTRLNVRLPAALESAENNEFEYW